MVPQKEEETQGMQGMLGGKSQRIIFYQLCPYLDLDGNKTAPLAGSLNVATPQRCWATQSEQEGQMV